MQIDQAANPRLLDDLLDRIGQAARAGRVQHLSRWDCVPTRSTPEGDLLIDGALATFQCVRHAVHDAGDHVLILGRIEHFASRQQARPLAFFAGNYGSFTPDQADAPVVSTSDSAAEDFTIGWG